MKDLDKDRTPEKTRCDCVKDDMESLGLFQKDAVLRNKRRRRIKEKPANPGSPVRWALKQSVCVLTPLVRRQEGHKAVTCKMAVKQDSLPKR